MAELLRIDVWSDVVCPWCAIGRARLRKALAAEGIEAEVHHRAFELDPAQKGTRPTHEVLRERYGAQADVEGMTRRVREIGVQDGLDLRTDEALSANTFDAHRLLAWAGIQGKSDELMEALVRMHFTDIRDISDPVGLTQAAKACGLDPDEARRVLDSGTFSDAVRADEEMARNLGIRGVPFFVFGQRFGMSGAQPVDALQQAIRRAMAAE